MQRKPFPEASELSMDRQLWAETQVRLCLHQAFRLLPTLPRLARPPSGKHGWVWTEEALPAFQHSEGPLLEVCKQEAPKRDMA